MYTPACTISSKPGHMRIGLQGAPGTGKTTSALTFPNPFAIDFDHKLPNGTPSAPFWDPAFVDSIIPRSKLVIAGKKAPPNTRDAFMSWFMVEHSKFEPEQTLVIDSYTMLDTAFHSYLTYNPILNAKSEIDTRAGWGFKLDYLRAFFETMKGCRCNVVMTFHETQKTDVDGEVINKLRPVMQGSFRDHVAGFFTGFYRCHKDPIEVDANGVKLKGPDGKYKIMPPGTTNGYYWQVQGDELFDAVNDASIKVKTRYVPATYQSLVEMRNNDK